MINRNKRENDIHRNKYNGLGGKFEKDESPEECVKREIFEESGLIINNPKLVGNILFPGFANKDWQVYVYVANDYTGEKLVENHEGSLHWIDDDKLLDLPLWESDYIFIPWIMEGKQFRAKFNYDNDKMIDYDVSFDE